MTNSSRQWLALGIAGIVAAGALAACTDSSPGSGPGADAPAARTVDAGKPISEEKISQFTVGILGKIPQLDPVERVEAGLSVGMNVLEPLLRVDAEGQIQPWLATGFTEVSDTVYEYALRDDVTFWDGSPLTAEDVKYTWERSIELDGRPGFASVDTIEAPGEHTVRVTLTKPDASWKYTPTMFYAVIYQKKFAEQTGEKFGQPATLVMGTGPWQVKSLNPTAGMELTAYSAYWGGGPPMEKVSVKFFAEDNPMALALRSGEIDVAQGIAAPKGFDSTAGGDTITTVPTCATALLSMPTQTAPWDDVHVRRAVAHAINREDIVAATQGRSGGPLETLISPILLQPLDTEDQVSAALDSIPSYAHDVEKAKAELAKSKVPDGFSAKLKVVSSDAAVAQVIAAQLSEIGIKTDVVSMQDTAWYTEIKLPDTPFTFTETGACVPDPSWDDFFLETDKAGKPVGRNIAQYTSPEVKDLMAKGLTTLDAKQRLTVYTELLTRLGDEVPYVPIYSEGATYASKKFDVVDYGSYALNFPWLLNVVRR